MLLPPAPPTSLFGVVFAHAIDEPTNDGFAVGWACPVCVIDYYAREIAGRNL